MDTTNVNYASTCLNAPCGVIGIPYSGCTCANQALPLAQTAALTALYNSAGGATWTAHTNWLVDGADSCTWLGACELSVCLLVDLLSVVDVSCTGRTGCLWMWVRCFLLGRDPKRRYTVEPSWEQPDWNSTERVWVVNGPSLPESWHQQQADRSASRLVQPAGVGVVSPRRSSAPESCP